jgi:transcription antitermination factor NusG
LQASSYNQNPIRAAGGSASTHEPGLDEPLWFVCHTKPRCEKKFALLMTAEQFDHYLPLITSVRRYPGQVKKFTKPLFPGYVFAHIHVERRSRIFQQDLLARVIPVSDETKFLAQLEDVRAIRASGLEVALHPILRKGTNVRIVVGPLKGVHGMVDNPANPAGVVVAVDVLQQGVLIKIPMSDLQILP